MIQTLYRMLIELTNRKWSSYILKIITKSSISRFLIPAFSKVYKINEWEIEKPINEYNSLHDFFIRRLKEGVRNQTGHSNSVLSPVDAIIEDIGEVDSNHFIMVKGKKYSMLEMLGKSEKIKKYEHGTYIIFYLSPAHYHRIHSPISGKISDQWTLGSTSYPVNKMGLKYGKKPLAKNYRTITEIQHEGNAFIAMVKVGAMFVNSIELVHEGMQLIQGKEMAYFSFGSTVILLFEKGSFKLNSKMTVPTNVKVGEVIGELTK